MRLSDLITQLDTARRREFERHLRAVRVRKGQTILDQGTRGTDVYLIKSGQFQALVHSASGKEVSLRVLTAGDLFGELAALDLGERTASVVALTDGTLEQMSGQAFKAFLQSAPEAAIWLATHLAGQIRALTERIFELSALDVRSRLHCELYRLAIEAGAEDNCARIQPAPTHNEIANRIGTHREAVTRELGELTRIGVLKQARRQLTILDVAALAKTIHHRNGESVGIFPKPATLPIALPPAKTGKTRPADRPASSTRG